MDIADLADKHIEDQILTSLRMMANKSLGGEKHSHCSECDCVIPQARQIALPGVDLCFDCAEELEQASTSVIGRNYGTWGW